MDPDLGQNRIDIDKADILIVTVDIDRNRFGFQQLCHIGIQVPAAVNMNHTGRVGISALNNPGMTIGGIYIADRTDSQNFRVNTVPALICSPEQIPAALVQALNEKERR